ncbi:hypothetical protein ACG7TL_001471 [Trametes sanguinea]
MRYFNSIHHNADDVVRDERVGTSSSQGYTATAADALAQNQATLAADGSERADVDDKADGQLERPLLNR